MMLIKVCGLKEPDNIRQVGALSPDLLGFIFYKGSPRYMGDLPPEALAGIKGEKIGVFVNERPEVILRTAAKYKIYTVQLHGEEPPEYCWQLRAHGCKVWKAVGIARPQDFLITREYGEVCDGFVFDSLSTRYGGTGKVFDWELLTAYTGKIPFLLSGGIAPEHCDLLKCMNYPAMLGVDLNSRFEVAPGRKNIPVLKTFIEVLRRK